MCSHEANIYESYRKFDYSDNTIGISFYIKHITLVPYTIHTVECLLHVGKTCPVAALHYIRPNLQREQCVRMCFCKLS